VRTYQAFIADDILMGEAEDRLEATGQTVRAIIGFQLIVIIADKMFYEIEIT